MSLFHIKVIREYYSTRNYKFTQHSLLFNTLITMNKVIREYYSTRNYKFTQHSLLFNTLITHLRPYKTSRNR